MEEDDIMAIDFSKALKKEPQDEVLERLDAESACNALKRRYGPEVKRFVEAAKKHEIQDKKSQVLAIEMAGKAKLLSKAIEAKRKEIINEPYRFVQTVNKFCKVFKDQLADAERALKAKINRHLAKVEAQRREQEKKAREEARKLQEKLEKEAARKGIEAPTVPDPVIPEKKVYRTESASVHLRENWTWELEDFPTVPDAYKALDEKKINKAVRAGIRSIPGIRIFKKQDTVLRT